MGKQRSFQSAVVLLVLLVVGWAPQAVEQGLCDVNPAWSYRVAVLQPKLAQAVPASETQAAGEPQAAKTTDALLRIVPAETLFCVRVNNFEYTLSQIDQFLAGISLLPMGISILARSQFAQVLGNPELTGVNMAGSFAIFATAEAGESAETAAEPQLFVAALAPVTDFAQFVRASANVGLGKMFERAEMAFTKSYGKYDISIFRGLLVDVLAVLMARNVRSPPQFGIIDSRA